MQSVRYKEVLNAVSIKLGYDPDDTNFPRDESRAIGTYIDQWVRRLYPSRDWPEWTHVKRFQPDANHIVQWTQISPDTVIPPSLVLSKLTMWRVLAVYLVDPRITPGANQTKFYLREEGIHCGFDHGINVWIKYIEPPPRFTSVEWDSGIAYKKDDVVYSLTTGDCYKSKSDNNLNHDPAFGLFGNDPDNQLPTLFIPTETVQDKAVSQLGTGAQNKIMVVRTNTILAPGSDSTIPDPPPASASFRVTVMDSTGSILGTSFKVATGITSLSDITTDLATQLSVALGGGWTVTADTVNMTITIENASDFQLVNPSSGSDFPRYYATAAADHASPLVYFQQQAYVPSVSTAVLTPQVLKTTFSTEHLVAGATYNFAFKDLSGVDHLASYASNAEDGQDQIVNGILGAIQNAAVADNYFGAVLVSADGATPSITFTVNDHASLNATVTLPGSPWWGVVPFPLALVDQVISGAYSDALKDWGQTDKGMAERQSVGQEAEASSQKFQYDPTAPLTEQTTSKGRYEI